MATSGVITAIDTASDIIKDALIEIGVISANQTPKAADAEVARRRLNWMLKAWQDDGIGLWLSESVQATVPAGTDLYELQPRMADVWNVRIVMGDQERSLARVEIGSFIDYPNKSQPGTPAIYIPTPGLDAYGVRFWPVPAEDTIVRVTGPRVIQDVAALSDNVDVPRQYTRTVMMNLASELTGPFQRANDPNCIKTIREAARLYQVLRAADRPSSYFLTPEGGRRYA